MNEIIRKNEGNRNHGKHNNCKIQLKSCSRMQVFVCSQPVKIISKLFIVKNSKLLLLLLLLLLKPNYKTGIEYLIKIEIQ